MNLNIILVGSNPLPCYIQAAYVLQKGRDRAEEKYLPRPDKILFVVTQDTGKYCENIKEVLQKNCALSDEEMGQLISQLTLDNGRDMEEIESRLSEEIRRIKGACGNESMHILLNDTGGTKMMTVYATVAARKFVNCASIVECYVDAVENRIRCHGVKEGKTRMFPDPVKADLRSYVKLSIDQLVSLHFGEAGKGKELAFDLEEKEEFIGTAQKILTEEYKDTYEKFYFWYGRIDKKDPCTRKEEIGKLCKKSAAEELFQGYHGGLYNFTAADFELFGSGRWLEKYFCLALLEAKKILEGEHKSLDIAWSYVIQPKGAGKNFEVDVLALRGYVLTLYSISMVGDGKGEEQIAKGKWFEAVYRAEQMAGEHGKVQIVNFLKDSSLENFKEDLHVFNREVGIKNREAICNFEDLAEDLADELA